MGILSELINILKDPEAYETAKSNIQRYTIKLTHKQDAETILAEYKKYRETYEWAMIMHELVDRKIKHTTKSSKDRALKATLQKHKTALKELKDTREPTRPTGDYSGESGDAPVIRRTYFNGLHHQFSTRRLAVSPDVESVSFSVSFWLLCLMPLLLLAF